MNMTEKTEENSKDRLSNLPEALLASIISLIPTKQAVATAILSRRWRYIWHSVTCLHLSNTDEQVFTTSDDNDTSIIRTWESMLDSIELLVQGPIHACSLSFTSSRNCLLPTSHRLNKFLHKFVGKGIRELSVMNRGVGCYELPSDVFFSPILEKLELGKCMISLLPMNLNLSSIRSLILSRVYFTDDHFHKVVSCCRLLESLKLDCCEWIRNFKIDCAPRLKSLEILTLRRVQISVRNVSHLQQATFKFHLAFSSFLPSYDSLGGKEGENEAEKLVQLLMDLSQCNLERLSLNFGLQFCEGVDAPLSLPLQYQLQSVKTLNLEISLSNLQVNTLLSCLLNSCPNLEELRIHDKENFDTVENYWESQVPSWGRINHLRIIQICQVNLHRSYWVGFLGFLLVNTCVCERMTIQYKTGDKQIKELMEQQLKMFQWASPHAVLEIKPVS